MSIIVRREQNQGRQRKARGRMFQANRGPGRRGRGDQMISHPPQISSYGITRDVRLRFVSNAGFIGNITYQNLLDTVLLSTTAVLGTDLFTAVRVNKVEAWAVPALGAAATVSVIFDGGVVGAAGDQKLHTDTSMGIEPAHVSAKPDPLTQAGQFQASSANNAFELEVPSGTVIDVSMTLRNSVNGEAVAAQNALVGATAGVIYYRGLDGKPVATTVLPVVGTNTVQ
jgi:hypothetical protein